MKVANFSKMWMKSVATSLWWLLIFGVGMSLCNDDKVNEHLKRLNKPHIKSIYSPDGDIIDCVHISLQIALDHPSLKDHIIQMKPSYVPKGSSNEKELKQMWHLNGTCPEETIPVRRTTREEILRSNSVETFGMKQHNFTRRQQEAPAAVQHEHAIAYVSGDKYYGAQATIDVWTPYVQRPEEFSLSQLWVIGVPFDSNLNTIEAGWQVYPGLYQDYRTRLFIYWTRDNYQNTGCYNLLCSGFIQTNNNIVIGGSIAPISTYNGLQYAITILVWKDPNSGNWWLRYGSDLVGYWPSTLFNRLNNYATLVEWGGEIVNYKTNGIHTSTDMGSGHFPNEGFAKASFFNNVQTVDGSNTLRSATNMVGYAAFPNCYDVKVGTSAIAGWGSYFYYGGSGQNPNCP